MIKNEIVCVELGGSINPSGSTVDLRAVDLIADEFLKLVDRRYKIIAFVGPGGLGETYLKIARKYSKKRNVLNQVQILAARVNALLLTNVLLDRGLRTRSLPTEMPVRFEEMKRQSGSWDVQIVAAANIPPNLPRKLGAKLLVSISNGKVRESENSGGAD
jgi:uridylate kinase